MAIKYCVPKLYTFAYPKADSFTVDSYDGFHKNSTPPITMTATSINPSTTTISRYFNKFVTKDKVTGNAVAVSMFWGGSGLLKGNTNLRPLNGSASAGYAFPVMDYKVGSSASVYFDVNGKWTEFMYSNQNWYDTRGIYTVTIDSTSGDISIQKTF